MQHIPLGQLAKRMAELEKYKDKPIVVACRSGHRSASACRTLKKHGFEQAHNLSGGIIAWEQASLPVTQK
jgi:rhodanese-related sulfurtransferase